MAPSDDSRDLRRCVRDLLALTALSAYWSRASVPAVAEGLGDVTLRSLSAEFAYVRVSGQNSEASYESLRTARGPGGLGLEDVSQALAPFFKPGGGVSPRSIANPVGNGTVRVAVSPIGFEGESGVVVVGSLSPDFPTQTDTLLLNAAVNQAAIVLQHRQAEATLRESEERFARFMQHLPGLAWIKDVQGRYVYANQAAESAFGAPRELLYGRTDDEVFPPATAAQFKANDRQALDDGAVQTVETLNHPDGVVHHSLVSKFAIPGPGGEPAIVGGVAIDITDRLRAEEALREADRRKDEFLATLAHELRNPLAPIRNGLELIRLAGHDPGVLEQARTMMDRQLHQMVRLIDDLLDVSRITRGKLELRKERTELAAVIQSAVETSRPLVEAAGHALTVTFPPEPIPLEADQTRLAQVFSNLLNNAAKYTDRGGRIELTAERRGDVAVVTVRDDGIGIPADMLTRIFDMFTQVDRSLEKQQGGLGIGLTLVKRLVELHGGTVTSHSDGPKRGSEFVVCLPTTAAPVKPTVVPTDGAPRGRGTGRRLLVADDNTDAAESLAMMLRLTGHEVRTAHDGLEAMEAAAAFRPDVVLLDIGMPRLNGYEAARRIREQPWGRVVTLIALTGWGQPEDRHRAAAAGFDHHLTKPVGPEALERLLASLELPSKR